MSKLLFEDSKPLLIIPKLAELIGLNEAIVIQQIHYWIEINKANERNYRNGHYWTYNSYSEWKKQFPFWSKATIQRIFKSLENKNLIISDTYNKANYDRTKWYTIPYDFLNSFYNERKIALYQNDIIDNNKLISPIPENNTENNNNNGSRKIPTTRVLTKDDEFTFSNKEIVNFIKLYMNDYYVQVTGNPHPFLKKKQFSRIYNELLSFSEEQELESGELSDMAVKFLNSNIDTDYNLNHFATQGILLNRFFEELY